MAGFGQDDEEEDLEAADQEEIDPESLTPITPAAPDRQAQIQDYLSNKFGAAADDSDVKEARQRASQADSISSLAEAAEGFARADSQARGGAGVDHKHYDKIRQGNQVGVQQAEADRQGKIRSFLQQNQLERQGVQDTQKAAEFGQKQKQWGVQNDEHDPDSETSAGVRATYGKMFPDVVNNLGDDFNHLSAADIKAHLTNPLELKARMDTNKEIAASRAQERRDAMTVSNQARSDRLADASQKKIDKTDEDTLRKMGDDLDPSKGRNGALGVATQKIANAQALDALAKGQGSNLDSRQMEELAIGMNRLLSGSNASATSQVKALVPETAQGSAAKLKEWLMNEPTGTNQQAFAKRMMETVGRESEVAKKQIETYQRGKLGKYESLRKRRPEEHDAVLKSFEDNYGVNLHPDAKSGAPATNISEEPESDASSDTALAAPALKPGHQEDGWEFQGGDAGDKKNWKKVGGK